MKIKKIVSKNKLIHLQLLKSKIYKKKLTQKYFKKIEIDVYKLYFKKIAHIIYEYHINNKKILFLNFPKNIEKNIKGIILRTKHVCVSLEHFLKNSLNKKNYLFNKNQSLVINKNDFNLILLFSLDLDNLNQLLNFQIPTILITSFSNKIKVNPSYTIPGYFNFIEKQILNNLFLCILKSVFKQARIKKELFYSTNLKYKFIRRKKRKYRRRRRKKNVNF